MPPAEAMPAYAGLSPWRDHHDPVPAYPLASNDDRAGAPFAVDALVDRIGARTTTAGADDAAFREQVRRLVVEELSHLIKG